MGELVGIGQRGDDHLVDLVADVALVLEGNHVLEAGARRYRDRCLGLACIFVANILDEKQHEDAVRRHGRIRKASTTTTWGLAGETEENWKLS